MKKYLWIPNWTIHENIFTELNQNKIDGVYLYGNIGYQTVQDFKAAGFKTFISVPCFEILDPDENFGEAFNEVAQATDKDPDGIILDFIRYRDPNICNIFKTKTILRFCKQAKKITKKLKMTNLIPFLWLVAQDPFRMKKMGTLCPMLYGNNTTPHMTSIQIKFWMWFYKKIVKADLEPCIRFWDTNEQIFEEQLRAIGDSNYSLFRYAPDIPNWRWNPCTVSTATLPPCGGPERSLSVLDAV